jgi:hypothetical protein
MSVENFDQLDGAIAFLGEDTPEHCFYCGKPLAGLTAYWHGLNGQGVALHPDCGLKLGTRLIRDSLNAQLLSEGKQATAGIGVGLVGS